MNTSKLLALLLCAIAPNALADSKPEAVVAAYQAAQNAKDVERLVALLSDVVDMRVLLPGLPENKRLLNRAQQRQTFANALRINPNAKFRILAQIVSGSTVVVHEEGTGLVGGMREVGVTLYRVEGDRISAIWVLNGEGAQREKR